MYTGFPSWNKAIDGEDGGYAESKPRKCATAASSPPAKTVAAFEGRTACCSAMPTAGRARPAAQPHTELITIITVPVPGASNRSTSAGVRASSTP